MTIENHDWQSDFEPDRDTPRHVPATLLIGFIIGAIAVIIGGAILDWAIGP